MSTQTTMSLHQSVEVKITPSKTFDDFTSFDILVTDAYGHVTSIAIFSKEPIEIELPTNHDGTERDDEDYGEDYGEEQ